MIEADVAIESGFMVLIVDVMNSSGHLKSLVTGTSLILSTSISLRIFHFVSDQLIHIICIIYF